MNVTVTKHFDYLTPFSVAENDDELSTIMRLKYPKACSKLEVDAGFFARMVEDVRKYGAWRVIGFKTFEDFCRTELGKTIDEVQQIVTGVKREAKKGNLCPTREQAIAAAAEATTGEVLPSSGEIHPGNAAQIAHLTQAARAKSSGVSRRTQQKLDRLPPGLRAKVAAGEISCNAAAIAAGIVKVASPLESAKRAYERLSDAEKVEFHLWAAKPLRSGAKRE